MTDAEQWLLTSAVTVLEPIILPIATACIVFGQPCYNLISSPGQFIIRL